jgi:hypothetical protein
VFLHASHNVFMTPIFSMLTADTGRTAYAIDEFGFLLVIVSALLAALSLRAWRQAGAGVRGR